MGRVSLYLKVVGASIRVCVSLFKCGMLCCSVVQYLPYGSTANFLVEAPMDSQKREEQDGNSDLCGIKIIKISPPSHTLFKKCKVQSECEWTILSSSNLFFIIQSKSTYS